jgi:hypothetical protein
MTKSLFLPLLLLLDLAQDLDALRKLDELSAANKYDDALQACADAEKAAIKAKDAGAVFLLRERKKELAFLKKEYDKVKAADEKLAQNAEDAAAADAMGRFYLFVKGDWGKGMAILAKSQDEYLKSLAEREAAAASGSKEQCIAAAEAWWKGSDEIEAKGLLSGAVINQKVKADKELVARARLKMVERSLHWISMVWPSLEGDLRTTYKERARRFAQSPRPAGSKAVPPGWASDSHPKGATTASGDGTYAHGGLVSIRIPAALEKTTEASPYTQIQTDLLPISGKQAVISVWTLSDGTANGSDKIEVRFFDGSGKNVYQTPGPLIPLDHPFWTKLETTVDVPAGAVRVQFAAVVYSRKGTVWIDDASVKIDGKEALKNGSFE